MKRGLTAYIPVRNGLALDYCWRESARSLLEVADELILCDSDSTDGTRDAMEGMAARDERVKAINRPWPDPHGDGQFLPKWLNYIRGHASYDMQLTMDADELIGPESHVEILRAVSRRECRFFHRYNFWRDAQHLIPAGYVCGVDVVRLAPTELWMVSDEAAPADMTVIDRARHGSGLNVYHYGFLRRPESFFAKSKVMQEAVCHDYDKRLVRAEATGVPWWSLIHEDLALDTFRGVHPPQIHGWLKERGYHE
jgi:glycosyltransferase involved in cell wall biosynthesis